MEKVARSRRYEFVGVVKELGQKFRIIGKTIDKGTPRLASALESHQRLGGQPQHNLCHNLFWQMARKPLPSLHYSKKKESFSHGLVFFLN